MHRAILEACLPCLLALAGAFALLPLLARSSGARMDFARLRRLPGCESGAVQSLSFVLTLPLFVIIVLFIIQVSQLMVGVMVVEYAAFAAVRAASVWLPADFGPFEPENMIDADVVIANAQGGPVLRVLPDAAAASVKYQKVQAAAVLACAAISPSRDLQTGAQLPPWVLRMQDVAVRVYPLLAPGSQSNPRIPIRLRNKLAYSFQNTFVTVEWMEVAHGSGKDVEVGPTYNPRGHPDPDIQWKRNEVGWQDPITVRLTHRFALLPGPGRFLAKHLVPADGTPDTVSPRITRNAGPYQEVVYTTNITASATLVNEGFKSVIPYAQR